MEFFFCRFHDNFYKKRKEERKKSYLVIVNVEVVGRAEDGD